MRSPRVNRGRLTDAFEEPRIRCRVAGAAGGGDLRFTPTPPALAIRSAVVTGFMGASSEHLTIWKPFCAWIRGR